MSRRPAILGGAPTFESGLAFSRPSVDVKPTLARLERVLESGWLTDGPNVRDLEDRVASAAGVRNCVAVASCTTGLVLLVRALAPNGTALLPSFTFAATAHAAAWNQANILFADCDPQSWCLGPDDVYGEPNIIIGVHVSGVPSDVSGLQRVADKKGASLIFDSAHGSGSLVGLADGSMRPLGGFGKAEVFSLTPTKVMGGAEGGLITTDDDELADWLRLARGYGNPGDYNTVFPGLNARLSEPHAVLALAALERLEESVEHRNEVATAYQTGMADIPGVSFQQVRPVDRSSYKDFTILIDGGTFGCDRDAVVASLHKEGIDTRPYYSPPVHRQTAYSEVKSPDLPVTDRLAGQVISLPMWNRMPLSDAELVAETLASIHKHADEIAAAV